MAGNFAIFYREMKVMLPRSNDLIGSLAYTEFAAIGVRMQQEGIPFHEAAKGILPERDLVILAQAEERNRLTETFDLLYQDHVRISTVKRRLTEMSIVPIVFFVIFFLLIAASVYMVAPTIDQSLTELSKTTAIELSAYHRSVFAASRWIRGHNETFITILGVAAVGIWLANAAGVFYKMAFHLPFLGTMMMHFYHASFFNGLYILTTTSLGIQEAVRKVLTSYPPQVQVPFQELMSKMEQGDSIAEAAAYAFSPFVVNQLSAGEAMNDIPATLKYLSEWNGEKLSITLDVFFGVLQPLLPVVLALAAGLFGYTFLMPMFQIGEQFGE